MTEQEWLECVDPDPLLMFLRRSGRDRKLRLFACACCHSILELLPDEASRQILVRIEQFADGIISRATLDTAFRALDRRFLTYGQRSPQHTALGTIVQCGGQAAWAAAWQVDGLVRAALEQTAACRGTQERMHQTAILRDIFGNPFRPPGIGPTILTWNNETVVQLARAIYEDRSFDRLPILADALEEAGCTDTSILAHCRGPGPHVLGCWVVDQVLGKE